MSVLEEVKYVSVTHTQTKQYTTNHNKKSIDCFYHNRVYFKASIKIMNSLYLKKFSLQVRNSSKKQKFDNQLHKRDIFYQI